MILSTSELSDLLAFVLPNNGNPIGFPSLGFMPQSPISLPIVPHQPTFDFEIRSPSVRTELVSSHNVHAWSYNALCCIDPIPFTKPDPTEQHSKHDVLPLEVLSEVFALSLPKKRRQPKKPARRAKCEVDGCNTFKQSNGRCVRHGGGKRCTVEGCTRGAQTIGRCKRHGGGARCMVDGCSASSQGGGLCRSHGGGKICTAPGCKKGAQRQGKCTTHSLYVCSFDCCFRVARCRGFCSRHKKFAEQ
ncbi:hypothetical protein V7S43_000323 [Phytophthora oleae]|uniref:WRKY19-like zinc finger domain-containing protein n=1 Tax=Phytophthora oleae TaxID=2107226 RepID=A0ABD3G5D1_9STRA